MDKTKINVVLASQNAGKIREFGELVEPLQIDLIPQAQLGVTDIPETGLSFVENALLKARHASQMTKLPAIADDSGLVVSALHGAPGIYSARYAGPNANANDNIQLLLSNLKNVPPEKRDAYFYCVLVFVAHPNDPTPLISQGKWHGRILNASQGESGFGYDPIFYVPSENKSAAELPSAQKNKISHRGIALQSLLKLLPDKLNECVDCTKPD